MQPQRLLCLDVSSTCVGYACFVSGVLDDFGKYQPPARKPAEERIRMIVKGIMDGTKAFVPDVVVMEWTDGRGDGTRARQRGGKTAGLAVLGQAQGAVRAAIQIGGFTVETVHEFEWSAGRKKDVRASELALEFPTYCALASLGRDQGYDIADAIGIGLWWLGKQKIERLLEPSAPTPKGG